MTFARPTLSSTLVLAGLMLFVAFPAAAADFAFPALRAGTITLTVPDRWEADKEPFADSTEAVHSARFIDSKDGNFVVLISVIVPQPAPAGPQLTPESVRASVARFADEAELRSVEPELAVKEFSESNLFGAYFSATDRAPDIDEFRFLTQGFAAVGPIPVSFTALSNRTPELARDELLAAIKSMRLSPAN